MTTFRSPTPAVIECDEGFRVEVLGRAGVRYSEGPRSMFVDSELGAGKVRLFLFRKSIRAWDPPHDATPVDDATRERIIENIQRAIRFQGLEAASV